MDTKSENRRLRRENLRLKKKLRQKNIETILKAITVIVSILKLVGV